MAKWLTQGFHGFERALSVEDVAQSARLAKRPDDVHGTGLDLSEIPRAVKRTTTNDTSQEEATESGFLDLLVVTNDDQQFRAWLTLSIHVQISPLHSV
jgi:hypothetical protein